MKNILHLTLVLTLALTACGSGSSESPSTAPSTPGADTGRTTISLPQSAAYRYDGYNLGLSVGESVSGSYVAGAVWTSSNPAVARVTAGANGSFTVTGLAAGTSLVRGTAGTRVAEMKVTVTAPVPTSTVTGVGLGSSSLSLSVGSSQTVTATVQGTGSFNPGVTWSSSSVGVAKVDSTGRVTAVAAGTATVTATSVQDTSKKASLTVTVSAPAPAPAPTTDPFTITVVFPASSNLSEGQKAAFTSAAARWSKVISAGLPDVGGVRLSTGQTVTVDDVTIVASGVAIDGPGQILGQAGPRQVRGGTTLPLWGEMQFDSADLASMEAGGTLQGVITHEMGHVLGIGTLWNKFLSANATSCTSATKVQYTGTNGLAQYKGLGGLVAAVPVEDSYGEGTKCGHWKESVFQSELMTGFASKSAMPLSRITLGALADLGYSVNYAAADAYTIPSVSAQSLEGTVEIRERLITPDGFLDDGHGH